MTDSKERLKPPPWLFLMLEGRAVYELGLSWITLPLLRRSPRGDGHPVMVLPGFMASDISTAPLRGFLHDRGYAMNRWGQGRNLGPRGDLEARMKKRLRALQRYHGRKVSLIGWSLGGVYARELAREAPQLVRQVITLGSPFRSDPKANHSWRLFEWMSGRDIDTLDAERATIRDQPLSVPATAIYTRTDGITAWQCCREPAAPESENIEVEGSHCGLGVNPLVLYAIADRLALPEGSWKPFDREGLRGVLYRDPERPTSRRPEPEAV